MPACGPVFAAALSEVFENKLLASKPPGAFVKSPLPNELNNTENITVYHTSGLGKLKDNLTSSIFPTYITEIGLYDDDRSLVAYAKLSKPIPKSVRLPMRFFVRMDH